MCDAPPLRLHHINLRFSLGCEPDPRKLLFAARFAEYDQDTRTVWLRFKSHGGLTAMFTEKGDVLMRVRGPLEKAKSRACAIAAFVKQRSEPKAHFLNYRVTALNLSCRSAALFVTSFISCELGMDFVFKRQESVNSV
uniref:Uncharacterized protein n=1 Tax=Chromera velia CCMP2878 TaxID=1169474 RepID=A0A0G4HET5_9ALVE|eukprot:Cvel_26848.t1-p1 / transcript=Cvel_26848.t1 / gene=Cvel_26848 / organism=Chromera_velia_CCMP2878 / gene_product=hypothetical protein / transcript_product=hypothetical protein / location=Cvel_scaffold3254:678-1237(-) / protein_length=137 / sequence_SO=supercontig / SO=protein_coding / is_pseudo=false